jgi:diguanylate cyclase
VMAASYFSPKAILAHVVWILVASRVTLGVVETSGVSATIRWTFGSLLLVVAAVMMSRIVSERRSIEDQLRTEIEEKARLQREFEHLAHHDPLTGLPNRRRFEQELARELARATRHNAQLSVVSLDLDQFKEYNDAHGHVAGDRLLKLMASAWTERLRAADVIARIGGDEFVVVLPDCPPDDAERVVQRLCRPIPLGLTCSAGTACWDGRESAQELYARADRAMYEAKECTTVCAAGETASGVGN